MLQYNDNLKEYYRLIIMLDPVSYCVKLKLVGCFLKNHIKNNPETALQLLSLKCKQGQDSDKTYYYAYIQQVRCFNLSLCCINVT